MHVNKTQIIKYSVFMENIMYTGIIETIKSSVIDYETNNRLKNLWREPIVEIIPAKDKKLKILKDAVSSEHLMPCDIFPDAKKHYKFLHSIS
jgi:hypothetical protein